MIRRLTENLNNGFADFPGLSVTGSVPIKEDFINQTLREILQNLAVGTTPEIVPEPAAGASRSPMQLKQLAGMVKNCSVRADAGILTLNFEIRR